MGFKKITERVQALGADERGMTTVEYVIVLCLIAAVSVGTWQAFGEDMEEHLDGAQFDINASLNGGE